MTTFWKRLVRKLVLRREPSEDDKPHSLFERDKPIPLPRPSTPVLPSRSVKPIASSSDFPRPVPGLINIVQAEEKKKQGYPSTYQAVDRQDAKEERPEFFEPALKQFAKAYRFGDPVFEDTPARIQWYKTRRQVIDHLLLLIHKSTWKDHLVLRGSLLLKAWLGDTAREPGDIDWIFRPESVELNDPTARKLFAELAQLVSEQPTIGDAQINSDKIAIDDIWTYERASGRRIVFPWTADGLPPGYVQMDVVFGEKLFAEPVQVPILSPVDNSELSFWAATKAESLAWKLLWLENDMYPQGKDLYDAALLSEQTTLSHDLLVKVLKQGMDYYPENGLQSDFSLQWDVDWDTFKQEYPWVQGEAHDWQARLTATLSATFQDMEGNS